MSPPACSRSCRSAPTTSATQACARLPSEPRRATRSPQPKTAIGGPDAATTTLAARILGRAGTEAQDAAPAVEAALSPLARCLGAGSG